MSVCLHSMKAHLGLYRHCRCCSNQQQTSVVSLGYLKATDWRTPWTCPNDNWLYPTETLLLADRLPRYCCCCCCFAWLWPWCRWKLRKSFFSQQTDGVHRILRPTKGCGLGRYPTKYLPAGPLIFFKENNEILEIRWSVAVSRGQTTKQSTIASSKAT